MVGSEGQLPLVSVIVPARDAATVIEATLQSALAQTYAHLEVVVVDDGSRDGTAAVVEAMAARDRRITLLRQANAGVAAARNRGLAASRGSLIALLDADDLWHPEKLARQVAVMRHAPPRVGLVYAWSSIIDEAGRIVDRRGCGVPHHEGEVYPALILWNFVGNASAPVIRRACLETIGGFDPGLHARGAQGCEDLKLYLAIAERYEFAVVPEFLVGYRQTGAAMSRDVWQMQRSHELVLEEVRQRHPELPAWLFRWSRAMSCHWLGMTCLRQRRYLEAARFFGLMVRFDPTFVARPLFYRRLRPNFYWPARRVVGSALRRLGLRRRPPRRYPRPAYFLDLPPDQEIRVPEDTAWVELRRLARVAALRIHRPMAPGALATAPEAR